MTDDPEPSKYEHKLWPEYVDFCFDWGMANTHRAMLDEEEQEPPEFEKWLEMREEKAT